MQEHPSIVCEKLFFPIKNKKIAVSQQSFSPIAKTNHKFLLHPLSPAIAYILVLTLPQKELMVLEFRHGC